MKIGVRTPNLKKSFKARTVGKYKRAAKRAINPLYGKKGVGLIKDPKKAMYNKVYQKTTIDGLASIKNGTSLKKQTVKTTTSKKVPSSPVTQKKETTYNISIKDGKAKIGNKFYTKKAILRYRLFFIICGWFIILCGCALLPVGILFIALGIFFLICANAYKKIARQC